MINPSTMLSNPATEINKLLTLLELEKILRGIENIIVIIAIEIIVPNEKKTKKAIPLVMLGEVGSINNITAALPASPWTTPIRYDFALKKGINSGKNQCFFE